MHKNDGISHIIKMHTAQTLSDKRHIPRHSHNRKKTKSYAIVVVVGWLPTAERKAMETRHTFANDGSSIAHIAGFLAINEYKRYQLSCISALVQTAVVYKTKRMKFLGD
jgi:hypothetical protein